MITGKQRSYLKSLANTMNPLLQVGKNGINENVINQLNELLEAKELIKITVLKNSPVEVEEIVEEILEGTNSEFVQAIGNKLVIYKESEENKKIYLENI